MFVDPITVTINSVGKTLARVESNGRKTIYQSADGIYTMTISHQTTGNNRIRSMIRLDCKKVVTDPLTSEQDYDTFSDYHVLERPAFGFSLAEIQQQIAGSNAWLDNTAIAKIFGGES